jgi:hypothetical protein
MRTLKPRPTPAEALAVAAQTAPELPPAQMQPAADSAASITLRLRETTIASLAELARKRGQTIKQVVTFALVETGVIVAPADLEDRTPRRRGAA